MSIGWRFRVDWVSMGCLPVSIGGRFHSAPTLILGGLWKAGKARAFGGRRDDDPVTKVKLFLWQIL